MRAWVDVSQDRKFAKSKMHKLFTGKILGVSLGYEFWRLQKKKDQIYSKWRNANKFFMGFYAIVSSVT